MDSSSVEQGALLENRASNGASHSSEGRLDYKAKSDMPTEGAEINTTSINANKVPNEGESLEINSKRDTYQNGPEALYPDLPLSFEPTSSPHGQVSPGVAGFHDNLRKSQGTSAEGVVLRKEALQSLKLSLPMQETELCSAESSLPLEKEEQIRLQARRRLEEQLKQYRVKRHQERSSNSTSKTRPSSTLDPELMLNPEILPRASTVAMTKEYSFLRTSVPRGPKLGSLGLPAPSKEKRSSKSSKSSNIRSLADYRTENSDPGNATRNFETSDASGGSLKENRSGLTSVVSEISLRSETDDRLENSSIAGDSVSEIDGSDLGTRLDGNESDSSSYSSVSGRGMYSIQLNAEGKQGISYTVNGQEILPDGVGQFPSIREVLQAAAAEHHAQNQEVNGEVRSRRDSISSSVSMESSITGTHDEMLQVLKEKMRLEGQLEALSLEANQALKEKTELQAQIAALNMRLQAQMEHSQSSQQKQDSLSSEVATLKQSCWDLERAMADLQNTLEAKNASLASSNNDLQLAEEQYQRLMGKVEDMQKSVLSKDNAVHSLRQQMASLQNQLQQVQLERTTLTNKLKESQAEIALLQNVRQWYQQQLAVAQEARVRLQSEMANIQAGQMTQAGMLEHLKLENVSLSHQLTETQHRSIKEKERIAAQLQNIEADMLDQEAAFVQIQEAKTMVEDDLQRRLEEFEDEREQLQKMADSAATLEQELEQVKLILHQRDLQLESLQQEHLVLMKQLTLTQESLHTKEQSLNDLQTQYDELVAMEVKELKRELLKLRSEKQSIDVECSRLQKEVSQVHQQIVELESHLQSVQKERDAQIADGGNNQASHERIQALEIELQAVSHSKMMSEKELQEVISLTSQELRESRRKIKLLEEINKKLALKLEHEQGKLTGFGQSNIALREHSNILETVLAERGADLVQLNLRVQAVLNIQALQTAFEREKSNVNNLQKQVAAAKVDAAHNRRHYRAAVLELSEIKKELQAKELLVQTLQAEADKLHAIIECAHASFKALLLRQKGGICSERADALDKTPAARLLQALNWLHLGKNSQVPPAIKHVNGMTGEEQGAAPRPSVKWFDYQQQIWKGPVDLLTWGRGYVCVATDAGPRWMPARWVRPWLRPPE